jgi:hypothetical protein
MHEVEEDVLAVLNNPRPLSAADLLMRMRAGGQGKVRYQQGRVEQGVRGAALTRILQVASILLREIVVVASKNGLGRLRIRDELHAALDGMPFRCE